MSMYQKDNNFKSQIAMDGDRKKEPPAFLAHGFGHTTSPLKALLQGASRGLVLGFLIKYALNLLLKRKPLPPSHDVFRFSGFLSLFLGSFRFLNAVISNRKKQESAQNSAIAAGVASLSFVAIPPLVSNKGMSLYLLARAMAVLARMGCRTEVIPSWSGFPYLMFGAVNIPIMFGFLFHPELLEPGYYKFILWMGDVTHEGLETTLRNVRNGKSDTFASCGPHYHEGPCGPYCAMDFFYGISRAGRLYAPVHLLPLVLGLYNSRPLVPSLLRFVKGLLLSCLFLTSYQTIVKSTNCYFRNKLRGDADLTGYLSGFFTAAACMFETRSRVVELMLYCLPRGGEAFWNMMKKKYSLKPWNALLVHYLCFSSAVTILFSAHRKDFKPAYFNVMRFVLGA